MEVVRINERIVSIRMSRDDYLKLTEKSSKIGISVSAFIRYSIFKNSEVKENEKQ